MRKFQLRGESAPLRGVEITDGQTRQFTRNMPTEYRRLPIPMAPQTIAANGFAEFRVNPQDPFKVDRLSFPPVRDAVTGVPILGIRISGIKVGSKDQLAGSGEIDILNFAPDAVDMWVDFDAGDTGNDMVITVHNTTANPVTLAPCALAGVAK